MTISREVRTGATFIASLRKKRPTKMLLRYCMQKQARSMGHKSCHENDRKRCHKHARNSGHDSDQGVIALGHCALSQRVPFGKTLPQGVEGDGGCQQHKASIGTVSGSSYRQQL